MQAVYWLINSWRMKDQREEHCKRCWIENAQGNGFCQFPHCPCHTSAEKGKHPHDRNGHLVDDDMVPVYDENCSICTKTPATEPAEKVLCLYGGECSHGTCKRASLSSSTTDTALSKDLKAKLDAGAKRFARDFTGMLQELAKEDTDAAEKIKAYNDGTIFEPMPDTSDWGKRGSAERNELRNLIEAAVRNPSNGNRHEEAIVEFIEKELERTREEERNISIGPGRTYQNAFEAGRAEGRGVKENISKMKERAYEEGRTDGFKYGLSEGVRAERARCDAVHWPQRQKRQGDIRGGCC